MHTEYWYVLKAAEKGRAYFKLAPKIEPEPWYKNTKLSSVDTRTVNRIITTHTYTPNWLAKMGVQSRGLAISAKKKWEYNTSYTPATSMKFIRRRLTCDCLDKLIPILILKAIYEKGCCVSFFVGRNNKISEGHQNGRLKRSKINLIKWTNKINKPQNEGKNKKIKKKKLINK
jgi:hypothetical protein